MTTENLGLMQAMSSKMKFLEQRHRVISQNVANSDTPGYKPQDLKPVDFSKAMTKVVKSNSVSPEKTQAGHMNPNGDIDDPRSGKQREVYEVAPAGNAVILEEQMLKSSETKMDYNLMTTLYQKNVAMLRAAMGSGNQ